MDLVRVPKKEKLYDKEEILGRDASSVFPTQAAEPDKGQATRDLLGASTRFVSESQVPAPLSHIPQCLCNSCSWC